MNGAPTTVNEKCIATYIIIQNIRGHISFHTRAKFYKRASSFFGRASLFFCRLNKNKRCLGSSIVEQIYFQQTSCITVDLLQYYSIVVDFVVFLQGIATFFEAILFFAAQDCIGNLLSFRTTLLYFFTRLNKKINVVWDLRSSHRYILFLVEVLYYRGFTICWSTCVFRCEVAYCCFLGSIPAFQAFDRTNRLLSFWERA